VRRFILCIAAAFGLLIVKILPWMILTGGAYRAYGPEGTMIADNNDFGLALVMVFPIFFFLAKSESNRMVRRLFWFLAVCTVPAVFFTWSRGALVGLVVVVAFIFIGSKQKILLVPILLFGAILALFLTPDAWQNRMTGVVNDPSDRSVQGRYNAWHFAWNLARDYPITGGGFDTFTPELFVRYAPEAYNFHAAHSIYFGMLGEHGFVGLGLFLGLLGSCFISLRRLARLGMFLEDDRLVLYSRMFQASLLGFVVSGAFLGRHYFDLFFAIVAAIAMMKAAHESEAVQIEPEGVQMGVDEDISMEPLPGGLT
jgi:probable O-glycosylation ligase (exosortase A-associated)